MDDLASLDFDAPGAKAEASGSYNFDALLRSMPAKERGQEKQVKPAPARGSGRAAPDAFASLLPSTFAAPAARPAPQKAPASAAPDVWGLDAFESLKAPTVPTHAPAPAADSLLDESFTAPAPPVAPRDDVLGVLGRPIEKGPVPQRTASPPRRASPPPPLAQLVEMGFAADAARKALGRTATGTDVDAAVTILTQGGPRRRCEESRVDALPSEPPRPDEWQKQADHLRTQATELGSTMLKGANALWGSAKAQAQRALDEARPEGADANPVQIATGMGRHAMRRWGSALQNVQQKKPLDLTAKPRWMQHAEESKAPGGASGSVPRGPDRSEAARARPVRTAPAASSPKPAQAPLLVRPWPSEPAASVVQSADWKLAGNEAFRRGAYAEAEEAYTKALDVLAADSAHRVPLWNNRANVRLKNGDPTGAATDCSAVLAFVMLPGMHTGAGAPVYQPQKEAPLPPLYPVPLREAYAKSLQQRARAHEVAEQWASAKQDWMTLQVFERADGSGPRTADANRRAATEGVGRCDQMLRPARSLPASVSHAIPTAHVQKAVDAGRDRVRAQMSAQAEEDASRLEHKDAVDDKLAAWMAGKQGNVRALLASVDDRQFGLLWPGLNWKKVELHELLTDAQVKRGFTRAIAKFHPDKLPPSTTSVEQRMTASGIFHALNEAYHS